MEIYESASLGEILERAARQSPHKIAAVDGDRRIGFQELNARADALAAGLQAIGFQKGDRAAIFMKNSIELMTAFYALQKLGVIAVWANPIYRRNDAIFIFRNSEAKGIFIFEQWEGRHYLDELQDYKPELPDLEHIFVVGDGGGRGAGVQSYDDLIARGAERRYSPAPIAPAEDLSMLLYTSGTTGRPKGAMITHYAAVRAGWEYSRGVMASAADVFIGFLPMTHSYGCGAILIQPVLLQATLVLMDKFEVERAFRLIEREKITLQLGSPTHYILELNHPRRAHYDLSSVRAGMIAGMIAPEGLIARVEKEMAIYLTSFWGASEVGPGLGTVCPFPSPLAIREKYIGKPVPGTRIRVVDPETREDAKPEQIGELALSGWPVMQGYWKNPDETGRQIRKGWLFMGDLASCSPEGYLRIHGRMKDQINRGGYKINPYDLESVLVDHPKIEQVCVVATPNPVLGESICACVIPRPGETLTLAELREFMQDKVARPKLPEELCLMQDFPKLSGGVKIKKFGPGGLAELALQDKTRERLRN